MIMKCTQLLFVLALFTQLSCIRSVKPNHTAEMPFDTGTINTNISPFKNFDAFANGKWKDTATIPKGYSRWGSFNILNEKNEKKIENLILNSVGKNNKVNSEEQKIADLYLSYLDTVTREEKKLQPLQRFFDEIERTNSVESLMGLYFLKYQTHIDNAINFSVDADAKNSKMTAVYLYQNGLSIGDRDYYLEKNERNETIQKEFKNLIVKIFKALHKSDKDATQIAQDIYTLEHDLAWCHITKEERRDPVKTYNKTSIKTLIKTYPILQLDKAVLSTYASFDTVVVENLDYLKFASIVLKRTSLATLKYWFEFKLVNTYAGYLHKDIVEADRYFYKQVMNGVKTEMSIEKKAIQLVNRDFGNMLGKLFVQAHFPETAKKKVEEMIENMRLVYKTRIEKNTWMSEKTKQEALKKLAAFTYKIGYPKQWKNYAEVSIDRKNLLENLMNIENWWFKEMVKKIKQPVDKNEWLMVPQEVNAYYNPLLNEIVFPAGILQPPFYNIAADDAINYGGILAVIGHEFTHGFDDQGSQFDETGNLRVWWTEEDRKNFNEKAEKLGAAYTNYKGLKSHSTINAKFTMGENIADLGGITLAYYALLKAIDKKGAPKDIDGYNYQQRFFLSWAQVWRSIHTVEYEKNQIIGDPHAPANARINVTTSLLKEFQEAWKDKQKPSDILNQDVVIIW